MNPLANFLQQHLGIGHPVIGQVPNKPVNTMQANGHFSPAPKQQFVQNMPQVQSPQNLSQYGNAQGQHWMENDQGQKFGMPQLQQHNTVGDQRIVPSSNHYNRPAIAAPQWQSAPIKPTTRII